MSSLFYFTGFPFLWFQFRTLWQKEKKQRACRYKRPIAQAQVGRSGIEVFIRVILINLAGYWWLTLLSLFRLQTGGSRRDIRSLSQLSPEGARHAREATSRRLRAQHHLTGSESNATHISTDTGPTHSLHRPLHRHLVTVKVWSHYYRKTDVPQ